MAIELSLFVHESTYKKIIFLRNNASESFLTWICPLLKPAIYDEQEYIFFDGDEISCVNFMKQGDCGFVLARHQNIKYIDITPGNAFGIIDIVGSMLNSDSNTEGLHLSNFDRYSL